VGCAGHRAGGGTYATFLLFSSFSFFFIVPFFFWDILELGRGVPFFLFYYLIFFADKAKRFGSSGIIT
jgi:hypothetical protein